MANTTKNTSDATTGWSFDLVYDSTGTAPPDGGLVLQNMRHDGHNYARDVRVVGIWLKFELVDPKSKTTKALPSRLIQLSPAWFTTDGVLPIQAKPNMNPPADVFMMNYFTSGYALSVHFWSKKSVFDGLTNCQHSQLTIHQLWMFSPYGNTPPHEPSGGLSAARFHPRLQYELVDDDVNWDDSKPYTRVSSIRFDYRLHLRVDRSSTDPDSASTTPSNHAGIFRDADIPGISFPWNLVNWIPVVGPVLPSSPNQGAKFTASAFDAAEKPLALEVVAPALYQGLPAKVDVPADGSAPQLLELCWDNIHWWGHRKQGHISAPGAFHAVHMHWRWGAPIAIASGLTSTVGASPSRAPNIGNFLPPLPSVLNQASSNQNGTIFGALVDPQIWTQTIFLAVTKYDKNMDPDQVTDPSTLSTETFQDLFTNRGTPKDVYGGADCVLWYSTEIPRKIIMQIYYPMSFGPTAVPVLAATGGTVFLHGTFFAHDPERTGAFIGDTAELYKTRDLATIQTQQQWYRPPLT